MRIKQCYRRDSSPLFRWALWSDGFKTSTDLKQKSKAFI